MYEPDNEQIQAVIILDAVADAVAEMKLLVNDETLGVEIDPLGMFCQKTGHEIGKRNENSLFSLVKICGKEISGNLYNATSLNIHPAWLITDGEALDNLIDGDPIGYACYCFGLITAQFYQTKKNTNAQLQPWAERYWSLARANALLSSHGVAEITELNQALCRIVTFMPDTTQYLFKRIRKYAQTPDQLALLHCSGELTAMLHDATNRALDCLGTAGDYIKRTRFVDFALTPADAARGPSNVRKQKASARNVKEASMFADLAKLFNDAGLDFKPSDGAWKAKFRSVQEDSEAAMLADLENFGGSNLLMLDDENENDQSIEVRSIGLRGEQIRMGIASNDGIEATSSDKIEALNKSISSDDDYNNSQNENTNENYFEIGSDDGPQTDGKFADMEASYVGTDVISENENISDEEMQIAQDLVADENSVTPIMAEIARQVHENIVNMDYEKVEIIALTNPEFANMPNPHKSKPMTALERLRAKKGL